MKKLHTALKVGGYYDDELVELNNRYDRLLEDCQELRRRCTLRPQRPRPSTDDESNPSAEAPLGAWPQLDGSDPAFNPGSFPDRGHLVELMQRLVMPQSTPPLELLAETARREVLDVLKPQHTLEAVQGQLRAFFQRRRLRLTLQCELIASRMRNVRHWRPLHRDAAAGAALQRRLRRLSREIEAADARIKRLGGEESTRKKRPEVQQEEKDRPIPKSCTKKKLFDYNEVYRETASTRIFRNDLVVCLREMVWNDRSTRTLRRFLLQVRHLPVTHRQELWRSTLQLAQKALEEGDALTHPMLWQPRKQLASTLMDMARRMRIPARLEQDSGHTLASNVAKMFPEIFAKQEQEFQFASYPQLRRVLPEGGGFHVSAEVYRIEDAWLDLVPLQPQVSLHAQEQRAVMRGRMEGPVGNDPGCGVNSLQKELDFLSADARSAELHITQLAKERAKPGMSPRNFSESQRRHLLVDTQEADDEGEASGMESPEHLLKAFLMMRHLSARNLRRELLGLLNLFRFAQQKISHGVLLLQASATNGTRSNKKDIFGEKPEAAQEQPLLPGHLPPSFPLAFPVSCRGLNGPRLHEALEILSEAEYSQTGAAGYHEDVVDGNGLTIVHSSAVSDLKVVEQELLIIASYALDKVPEDMKSLVDCAGLLKEVLTCEVELCRTKWKLVKLQLSAFDRASLTKWDIAQRIVDVLARRPCFDMATGSFQQGYVALISALESRAQLQQTLTEYQLRSEEMSRRKLQRQAQVALRCGRRLELDLGHQRERQSREAAKQPTELAGLEMEEDPQLCVEDMLANPMEGLPVATQDGLLDFSDSLALVCQVDGEVTVAAERLAELAPEPCFRHRWEEACCKLMAKEWQEHVAQAAATSPGISSSIGIRLSDEARSNVFWGDQAEDPNWLLLQAEQVILKWQSEDSEGAPGPCRLKDPELAWAPFNEAVLRLSCRLLDQVRMRRQLLDTLCEVRALEAGLGRQAQLVGTIAKLRISETLPDLSTDFGEQPAAAKNPAPLLAAEAMLCFGDLDLSTAAGVRNLLQVDQMSELHHVVQHQISGKWLLVGCLLYNALLGDSLLRRSVDVSKGAPKWSGGRPWPPPEEFEESPPKMAAKSMQWPGTVRTVVYTQVGASIKETVRGLTRQIEVLGTASAKFRAMVIYRCRSLGYSSLFMLERACDLLLRVQAAQSCAGLRCFASMLPSQLSPLKLSVEGRRRMLLESDGTLQSILHIPQVEEVLYLRGTECPSIGRHVRDCEVSMPEPFAQIMQVEEAARNVIPHDHPVLPPQIVVGSPSSAWAHPTVEIAFTGTAVSTLLLLREICAITALAMFSASMSGDEILLLQALHAVEAAWGNKAQRAAAEHVLAQSMLDTAQDTSSCERHPKARGLEQRTWDALEHVRADFLHLEAQVKQLKEERFQVKPVLQLLRQQHRLLKLGALVTRHVKLRSEAWHAAVQKNWLPEAAELQRWALHLEGFPLEGGCRLALAASAMPEMIGMPQKEFPSLTEVMAGQEESDPAAITEFEALADEALERLWMSSPMGRGPFPAELGLEDEIKQAEACLLPVFKPEDCPHLHPLFHALCLHFAAPYDDTPFSNSGDVPAFVPLLPGRSSQLPRAMCRALLMLPGKMRRQVADIHLRMEMECDLLGKGGTDPELLEEIETLVQTRYAVQRLREMATTFLLLVPPTPTPKGFRQAEELLARELRCREEEQRRKEQRDTNNEDEPPEEPVEGSQSVEQLKAKQVLIALEMAIKVAGDAAAAAERAAEFEGDWLIMAKGGPGAQNEQEAGRLAVKNSLIECHDAIVHTVGIIVKCGLRFAAAGIERLKRHMEICLSSEGGKAALAFAQHLLSRANFVQTFCKDGQNAWIVKHSDLQESLQEIGRRMLQWAIVSTADQVASGRERIAQKAQGAERAEEKLLQVRLALWHQRRDVGCMLNAMVSDRVPREIFELDRLHRSHRAVCSAALEAEHRCCVNLHEQIVEKLGSLDDALSYSQNCFRDYRKEMNQGVQLEMRNLKQLLSNQLLKMQPQTLTVQNALKRIEKDDRDDPQVSSALKGPEPVQPQSAAATHESGTAAAESYVEAAIIGPQRPALQPGAQLQRKAALEEMHQEIAQMLAAGTRIHTFYDLKCQQLKQYYDEELHRLCGTLSSNREVWENVSEGRERQRLLAEEIARSQRRCEDANGEAKVMRKAIDEHEEYTKKMFHWNRKMMKAQGDLQHEMRKYERDGLVDVSKMESELGKLDAQLQQLSTSVPAEQIIDLIQRRGKTERMALKRAMKHEGYLLHKAAAKVQVIRSELEKGAQDQEDEPFAELLMEECNTLSRQIMELDQENKDLQSQLLKTGEIDLIVYQPRAERPQPQTWQPPARNVPEIFRDSTFEQELCFSVSFMKPPRGSTKRKQIDGATQSAQLAPLPERLGKSESFRGAASSGLTPRRVVPPRFT